MPFRKPTLQIIIPHLPTFLCTLGILVVAASCVNIPTTQNAPTRFPVPQLSSTPTGSPFISSASAKPTVTPQKQIPETQELMPTHKAIQGPTGTTLASPKAPPPKFIPIKGSADRIAFINANDIWVSYLDGEGLAQITHDGELKSNPRWSRDGQGIHYLSGNCRKHVNIGSKKISELTCFQEVNLLGSFEVSPNGNKAAINIDGQLYIIPYDESALSQVNSAKELSASSDCPQLAPYRHRNSRVTVRDVRWSAEGDHIAILRLAADSGIALELIQILDISTCTSPLPRLDEFPATRFEMKGYLDNPLIQNFAWDGGFLFALTNNRRNDGFGDLWIYNSALHRGFMANPIQGKCCYRDPVFSPDGEYLAFVFQDSQAAPHGPAQLYYLPFEALEMSLVFPPLQLPADFFSESRTKPQPILRGLP
jgi:hypothetical protein